MEKVGGVIEEFEHVGRILRYKRTHTSEEVWKGLRFKSRPSGSWRLESPLRMC